MKPQVKISETVLQRLQKLKNSCFGKLYGVFFKNTLIILGVQVEIDDDSDLVHSFPAEIDFCGVFECNTGNIQDAKIIESIRNIDVTDNPVFISVNLNTQNELSFFLISNGKLEKGDYKIVNEKDVYADFIHVHLNGELTIKCENKVATIKEYFQNLRKNISSGVTGFFVSKRKILLLGHSVVGVDGDPCLGDILEESDGLCEGSNKKKKSQNLRLKIFDIDVVKKVTKDAESKSHAPLCILDKKELNSISMSVKLDSLALVHYQTALSKVYEILLESTVRYLRLVENVFINHMETANDKNLALPETFHFYPNGCGHFITRVYLENQRDEDLRQKRQNLHKELLLDEDMPLFRRANNYVFKKETKNNSPLINPHEGLKPTVNGGHVALVKGKYEYYHYRQNNMDDNGWGCAYRSLQTLASWYRVQGYTDRNVPTFQEIQKCLVDIGDKPNSFVGSKQWIGSTEVSFVLNTLLGVTSKILYVSSGEEMGSKGPELVNHFETNGTPIMIGGGVLAHTILGVDYNQQTGNVMFLILDPHYTNDEDLHIIQSKGWCGWKNVDFWDKNSYYNMCMPQVTKDI